MSNARTLATLANDIGALAFQDTVAAASVTGLGSLATQNTVAAASVTGLGALATLSEVGASEIASGAVTAAKLGTDEQRRLPRAFGYVNGSTGALVAGFGLTASRSATGTYAITLTSAAPDTNFTVIATPRQTANLTVDEDSGVSRTTTTIPLRGRNTNTGTVTDVPFYSVAVFW